MKKEQFLYITTKDGEPKTLNKREILSIEKEGDSTMIFMTKDHGYPDKVYETLMDYRIVSLQANNYEDQ